jgi:hypothetical protein
MHSVRYKNVNAGHMYLTGSFAKVLIVVPPLLLGCFYTDVS